MDSVIVDEINNLNDDEGTNFMPKMKERAYNIAVSVSTTNVGQLLFKQLDNIFWITEKTAKWSCTPDLYGTFAFFAFFFLCCGVEVNDSFHFYSF